MPSFGSIKLLQSRTGASRSDCKKALEEHDDDQDAAAAALGEQPAASSSGDGAASGAGDGAAARSANQRALDEWAATEIASSVSVERVEAGDGKTFPAAGDTLVMHYRGTLQSDGTEFDSSYSRSRPFSFRIGVGDVIKGWDEGVMKMSLGEKAVLLISSDYAYGANGHGRAIPPNADLKFEVHLLEIQRGSG